MNAIEWELVHDFGPAISVRLLASGATPQGLAMYAAVVSSSGESSLLRSPDGGKTWAPVVIPGSQQGCSQC